MNYFFEEFNYNKILKFNYTAEEVIKLFAIRRAILFSEYFKFF